MSAIVRHIDPFVVCGTSLQVRDDARTSIFRSSVAIRLFTINREKVTYKNQNKKLHYLLCIELFVSIIKFRCIASGSAIVRGLSLLDACIVVLLTKDITYITPMIMQILFFYNYRFF